MRVCVRMCVDLDSLMGLELLNTAKESDELRSPYLCYDTHVHDVQKSDRQPPRGTWCTLGNSNVGDKHDFSEKCTVKNVFLQSLVIQSKKS